MGSPVMNIVFWHCLDFIIPSESVAKSNYHGEKEAKRPTSRSQASNANTRTSQSEGNQSRVCGFIVSLWYFRLVDAQVPVTFSTTSIGAHHGHSSTPPENNVYNPRQAQGVSHRQFQKRSKTLSLTIVTVTQKEP